MSSLEMWQPSPSDRRVLYSPIGFHLIDDLTAAAPLGSVRCALYIRDAANQFRLTDIKPVRSMSGFVIFPGLGRTALVTGQAPLHYRAVFAADFYRPYYATQADGIEFDAPWFSDTAAPAQVQGLAQDLSLLPATSYPFPSYMSVVRGVVTDATARPVVNAEVWSNNKERVLSDEKGGFALPLRFHPNNTPITIDATDHRTARNGQIQVTLPAALGTNHVITVN